MAMDPKNMSSAVSDASNYLGISLLRCLSKEKKNVFISPVSLSTALAMLHCGARGGTRQEMRKVFGYEDVQLADEDVATAFSHILSAWDNIPDSYILSCANSLVIDKKFHVKDEYKALMQKSFKASMFEADFLGNSQTAIKDINTWVEGKTNGKIPKLLGKLPPLTVLVLLNAIYFKGTWLHKFEEHSTRSGTFYNDGLKQNATQVQMMRQTTKFEYAERESFTALQLPYVGKSIAMMVLLPRSMDGVEKLEIELSPQFFKSLKKELRETKVKVSLPKFKFEYSKNVKDVLKSLGMCSAFERADLGGLSDCEALYVSDVIHKAVVEVNEEGSEAAAATAVVVALRSLRVERIPDFIVDHPFLFTIFDTNNDAILFFGRINTL